MAVERGPEVYCVESVDLPDGVTVDDVVFSTVDAPRESDGRVLASATLVPAPAQAWPYSPDELRPAGVAELPVELVPYHSWANRGPATMRVWLRAR